MARPNKQTVEYFPHVCLHGKTMYIVEQKYGNDGYSFWFKLLELLGATDGHFLDLNDEPAREFLVAKTHLEEGFCYQILDLLAKLNAIDRDLWEQKIVWSQNFVDNLSGVYNKRFTDLPVKPTFSDRKLQDCGVSVPDSEVLGEKTPQSKGTKGTKETEVKEIKVTELDLAPEPEPFDFPFPVQKPDPEPEPNARTGPNPDPKDPEQIKVIRERYKSQLTALAGGMKFKGGA